MTECPKKLYFPAVICAEYESPIDALLAAYVPQDEVMNLVAAAWAAGETTCVLASIDGGRDVAAIRLPDGRWASCNAFPGDACATRGEAERRLKKVLKRGRRGLVGALTQNTNAKKITPTRD